MRYLFLHVLVCFKGFSFLLFLIEFYGFLAFFLLSILGDSVVSVGKAKSKTRGKKRQLKSSNDGVAWGKLLSQCSQVHSHLLFPNHSGVLLVHVSC